MRFRDEQASWGSFPGCWRGAPHIWSLCQQGLQTWAQGPDLEAEQDEPVLPPHSGMETWSCSIMVRPHSYGGPASTGGGRHPAWELAALVPCQQTFSKVVSHLFHRAGIIECQEGKLGGGRSIAWKLYFPNPLLEKQPMSFNDLSQEQRKTLI